MYVRQCLKCGMKVGNYIAYRNILDPDAIEDWDDGLQDATWTARNEWYLANKAAKQQKWWDEYQAYLESEEWAEKRKAVLERDRHLCQACLKAKATVVHHQTYEHCFNEPLFDLISVCVDCHANLHGRDA